MEIEPKSKSTDVPDEHPRSDHPEWMSTSEVAELLGVQSRTLYRFIDEGRLPAYRFGRVIRVMRDDVRTFLQSCRIEPGSLTDTMSTASSENDAMDVPARS